MQSMQTDDEIHEHVDQTHTLTEQPLKSSCIEYDNLPENTTTELITDSAIEQKAQPIHHSIYPQNEVNASQTGNELGTIDLQECKSHAVIDTLQSVNVSETNLNETVIPTKFDKMPNVTHIRPSITTKQSLTSDETLTNDTYDDLRVAEHARSAKAHTEFVAVEAKVVDERYVQESESELTSKMPAVKSENADVSVNSMHSIEVQLRNVEENVSDLPKDVLIKPTSIDFDVPDQHSLNVTEIVCEQETAPFQSEPLAATATAVPDYVLHRPYNVEETLSSENEKIMPLSVATDKKQASVNVTSMDSVTIDQTLVNEFESDLVVSKPEMAKADNLFKPYVSMQTNLTEYYEAPDSLEEFKSELSRAEIEMNDHNFNFTETTNVYQSEEELETKRRPDQQQATPSFVTLKSSVTEQLVPNELETELKSDSANVVHATSATEPTRVPEISSVQPLESASDQVNVTAAYDEQTAKIDFERLKSAVTSSSVYSNEKETDLIEPDLQVQPTVRLDIVQKNPIESSITESLDSERTIETEPTLLRQSKIVPGHSLTLSAVNVIEPCDAVDSVTREHIEKNKKAKVVIDDVYGVSAYSVQPTEQATDGIDSAKPKYKFASSNVTHQSAIEISTKSPEETFSEMEIDLGKSENIPFKPSETVLQSANVFEPYSLENVGDVNELDHRKHLKKAGTQFDEHKQVNVTETVTSEQIVSDDGVAVQPSTAQATSQFTQQTAAAISVVLPSDSTSDVTYSMPELTESQFTIDTKASLFIQEDVCQEATTQIHPKDESKQYRPSSSFVPQIANEQIEVELLENPDILDLNKAEKCVGSTGINNAFAAPEVSDILIHGSESVFGTAETKPIALAKVIPDEMNALETVESAILESLDTIRRKEVRIDEHVPSTMIQEAFSHTVYTQNVFEKESTLEATDKIESRNVELTLESPLKPAEVTENIQLYSVERLPSDQIERIEPIKGQHTKKLIHSAAEETAIIFESEDYKEVDSCKNVNVATKNVIPQQYVTIETSEINDSTIRLETNIESKESTCHVTTEPCLPVTINETIIASEMSKDHKKIHDEFKTANLKVNESHKFDTYETISSIDCGVQQEWAKVRNGGELHGLEIIEKDHLERESHLKSETKDKISQTATVVDHMIQNLIKPIQSYEEKINIHIQKEYHKEQKDQSIGIHAIAEGKCVCVFVFENWILEFNNGMPAVKPTQGL